MITNKGQEFFDAHIKGIMDLIENLRRTHSVVEDCWYSCPKSGECCNDDAGPECACGADQHNALVDSLIALLFPAESARRQG